LTGPERIALELCRVGPARSRTRRDDVLDGVQVMKTRYVHPGVVQLRMPTAPSDLYFVRLTAPGGWLGHATVILHPRRLGTDRVAVVLPTNTWQAYNFRDEGRDGVGDTWYASASIHEISLSRPFLNRGVPPHFRGYDHGFLHWLARSGHGADVFADDDLERFASGDRLARLYDLIVFPGHEEYVTSHVFDIVSRYRDLGGNLMFLSANNFFYKVERRGSTLVGRWRYRDLGRPEAALIGAQYLDWNRHLYGNKPYVVTGATLAPWLFRGTGLHAGSVIPGHYGIEIDTPTAASPRGTIELARVPDVFGRGRSAVMTYYQTGRGAKVFAAGTIDFGGFADTPVVSLLMDNLWAKLSRP
jgi:hypothetical protein